MTDGAIGALLGAFGPPDMEIVTVKLVPQFFGFVWEFLNSEVSY